MSFNLIDDANLTLRNEFVRISKPLRDLPDRMKGARTYNQKKKLLITAIYQFFDCEKYYLDSPADEKGYSENSWLEIMAYVLLEAVDDLDRDIKRHSGQDLERKFFIESFKRKLQNSKYYPPLFRGKPLWRI